MHLLDRAGRQSRSACSESILCASSRLCWTLFAHCDLMQTAIKELRKGAQETKIELESRKQQQQQQQ
jgi:hypothetical protein